MIWVLLFPHLPLRLPARVGDWVLVPIGALAEHELPAERRRVLEGLLTLYGLPGERGHQIGAVAHRHGGQIGDPFERAAIPALRRAITAALLDLNPQPVAPDPGRPVGRGDVATTENGIAWGHTIAEDGWVAAPFGFMATTLRAGLSVFDPGSERLPVSPELFLPRIGDFDEEYAAALLAHMGDRSDGGRRLATAIDWLLVAWQNTASMEQAVRVLALKTGFEVLFEQSSVGPLRDAVSALFDTPEDTRALRTWMSLGGQPRSAQLTDLAWGFQQFTYLRNAIAHGSALNDADFLDDQGIPYLRLGEWWLRRAIREIVTRAGHEDLRLEPRLRQMMRRVRELGLADDEYPAF